MELFQVEIIPKFYEKEEPNFALGRRPQWDLKICTRGLSCRDYSLQVEQVRLYDDVLSHISSHNHLQV
jgi:hypothetical protein